MSQFDFPKILLGSDRQFVKGRCHGLLFEGKTVTSKQPIALEEYLTLEFQFDKIGFLFHRLDYLLNLLAHSAALVRNF